MRGVVSPPDAGKADDPVLLREMVAVARVTVDTTTGTKATEYAEDCFGVHIACVPTRTPGCVRVAIDYSFGIATLNAWRTYVLFKKGNSLRYGR